MATFDISESPTEFIQSLKQHGRRRLALIREEDGTLWCGDPVFKPLAKAVEANTRDFDFHEALLLEVGRESGALLGAFLHRTVRGQGAGGVRRWNYDSVESMLSDGLRLARGMGRKNSLAGLWWGGGKGVICQPQDGDESEAARAKLYRDYGRFITSLRGAYVTAEDVGTRAEDMASIYQTTRFVTCVPEAVGGSGNPSPSTAHGVVCAMEAALDYFGTASLEGQRIAMQGVGNVGGYMVGLLLERGVKEIIACDISDANVSRLKERYPDERLKVSKVAIGDDRIIDTDCDIFAPNALGGILNPDTISRLKVKMVCGAANNQLLDQSRDAELLKQRGIHYVPDFLANRMGIVQCANEQYGSLPDDPSILKHFDPKQPGSIQQVTHQVLRRAEEDSTTSMAAANQLADEMSLISHPIWPGRTRDILNYLRRSEWYLGAP